MSLSGNTALLNQLKTTLAGKAAGGGGTAIDLGISGATVGQIAKILSVDETGKPTAWEAVELPGGGGGAAEDPYELIAQIEITEAVSQILQDFEKSYKELYIMLDGIKANENCQLVAASLPSPNGFITMYAGYKSVRLLHRPGIGVERQSSDHGGNGLWIASNVTRNFDFSTDADFDRVTLSTSNPTTATLTGGTIKIYGR